MDVNFNPALRDNGAGYDDAAPGASFQSVLEDVRGDGGVQQVQMLLPLPAAPSLAPAFGGGSNDVDVDGAARSIQHGLSSAVQLGRDTLHDGVEGVQALEYRGQLRSNTLSLLGQTDTSLRAGLNPGPSQGKLEIHHTVPYADPKAADARGVLEKWGISIHDPADAAIVPTDFHRGEDVHGMANGAYNDFIRDEFLGANRRAETASATHGRATGRAVILNQLRRDSDFLVGQSGDARAIGLEQTLRTIERPLPRPDLSGVYDWRGYGR